MYDKVDVAWSTLKDFVVNEPDKKYEAISPSSLGGCMRVHYWKLNGVKPTTPPNPSALVNFKVGHFWEQVMADAFESKGMLVKHFKDGVDKFYDPETMLGGTPDLLIKYKNGLAILDSKTVNSAYFRYAKKYKKFDDWVEDNRNYVYQQVAYVYLARLAGYKVDRAILSFASKDDGYIGMEFEITVTDELIDKVKYRAKTLKKYLDDKQLPPCTCTGWQIGYCSYGDPTTQQPNAKKKIVNTTCCAESINKENI